MDEHLFILLYLRACSAPQSRIVVGKLNGGRNRGSMYQRRIQL